ncbi:MAG: hypothetical protein RR619_01770, partial [Raoultibacter sp.]
MGDVVFKANQYKIARTDAGLSNITDGTKAKVQTIVITDTKSPYYMATVSVDTVPSAQFDVRALDLSDKSLALKVQTTTAAGVEKDGLESISAVYKASAYNLADAVAGNVVNEKDYNVKKIMATVNGDTFDISAIVDAEIEGYAKNVGSYAVKVEANSVNAAGVTKTASVANAVKVTPYDLSADYANIKFAAAATSVNYTAEAGYPAKLKAVEFGNSGHTVVIPEGEVAFEVYKRTGGTVSGSAITPIDAGTYRVYINAASKNFTGSTKSAGLTNNTVYFDYAIAAVSFATVKIELDQSNGYYPVSSAPVKPQVTATLGDIVLDPTAYAVDYTKIKAGQGKYDLTVTPAAGNKNFTANTKVVTPINVVGATDLRTAKVTLDYGVDGATSYTYTVANGYAKVFNAPTVVLTLADGTVLKSSNNDFTAVTATPKASAVNKYTWSPGITLDPSIASKYLNADKVSIPNWIIAPASMEDAVVEDVPNYNVKDGSTAVGVVAPKVTFNGATLTSGTDYDLVYYSVDPDGVKSKLANGVADIKAVGT